MKQQERAYPVSFVGHRQSRVIAITQELEDGSKQTVVLTLEQLERIVKRAQDEIAGASA